MNDLELAPLAADAGPELRAMTFPAYRHLLDLRPAPRHPELGETRPVQPFGVVARRQGRAVGLALGELPLAGDTAEPQLLSLFVAAGERRRGVATALVGGFERAARAAGHARVSAVYTTGKPAIDWVERIFARRGWDAPRPGSLVAQFRPADALASERFQPHLLRGYRRGMEIVPWQQVTAAERDEIRHSHEREAWIIPALVPWQYPSDELDASSVAARFGDRIVGWVLNHRSTRHTVRWSISYMHPELARRGKILALYHASLSLLHEEGSCALCTFTTPYSYGPMTAFARRWISPFALSLVESRLVGVDLAAAAPQIDPVPASV